MHNYAICIVIITLVSIFITTIRNNLTDGVGQHLSTIVDTGGARMLICVLLLAASFISACSWTAQTTSTADVTEGAYTGFTTYTHIGQELLFRTMD